MSEEQKSLVLAAQAGDKTAFNRLVKENREKMFALTYRMTGDRETALDLVQETFLTAFRELPGFRGESSFSSWLYRIASNKALNYIKRRKLVSFLPFGSQAVSEPSYEMPDATDNSELKKALAREIASLPDREKLVFNLRFYDELPFGEIARVTGRSESTVKTQYQQAVKKLRGRLKEFRQ
jgi:RNA polymerase sigma-70 factor (ECF subfamily)